jgi:hypothetical protein
MSRVQLYVVQPFSYQQCYLVCVGGGGVDVDAVVEKHQHHKCDREA